MTSPEEETIKEHLEKLVKSYSISKKPSEVAKKPLTREEKFRIVLVTRQNAATILYLASQNEKDFPPPRYIFTDSLVKSLQALLKRCDKYLDMENSLK